MADASAIAKASNQNGRTLNSVLVTPGIKQTEIVQKINGLAQQEQQNVQRAESLSPPGHLRDAHQHMIESLQFRVSGLRGLATRSRGRRRRRTPPRPARCSRGRRSG